MSVIPENYSWHPCNSDTVLSSNYSDLNAWLPPSTLTSDMFFSAYRLSQQTALHPSGYSSLKPGCHSDHLLRPHSPYSSITKLYFKISHKHSLFLPPQPPSPSCYYLSLYYCGSPLLARSTSILLSLLLLFHIQVIYSVPLKKSSWKDQLGYVTLTHKTLQRLLTAFWIKSKFLQDPGPACLLVSRQYPCAQQARSALAFFLFLNQGVWVLSNLKVSS